MSSLLGFVRTSWILLGLTLFLFLMIEVGARLLFAVRDAISDPYVGWCDRIQQADAYRGAAWPAEYCEDEIDPQTDWRSYVYWRRRPVESRHVNVDADGIRRTWNPTASDGCREPARVFVIGGSTIWGPAVRDDHTIPSRLSRDLADAGLCAQVTNLGESGYVTTQELILLITRLQRGDVPDVAVFYDGVNELFSAFQNGEAGLPQNEDHRRQEFAFFRDAAPSRLTYLAKALSPDGIARLRDAVQGRLGTAQAAGGDPARDTAPAEGAATDQARLIDDSIEVYKSNLELIELLADHYGFDVLFYWQPMIFTKKNLSEFERGWYEQDSAQWRDFLLAAYSRVHTDPELSRNPRFRSLAAIFDDRTDPFYVDTFHLTEDGNGAVASQIAVDVARVLRAERVASGSEGSPP